MEMETQGMFYSVGNFDRDAVDIDKTPTTVEEYLQQVIVTREQIPEIAVAENFSQIARSKSGSAIDVVPKDASVECTSRFAPGKEWNVETSNYFSFKRSIFEGQKASKAQFKDMKLPNVGDSDGWCKLCFERRPVEFRIEAVLADQFAHHKGIPPTLNFVKTLGDNQINHLILHVIEHTKEQGYSRARMQWLLALLLAVKKPLLHDVCSALRDFTRQCRVWRSYLDEDEMPLIHEYTAFIAIVSIYFGQKDLADT